MTNHNDVLWMTGRATRCVVGGCGGEAPAALLAVQGLLNRALPCAMRRAMRMRKRQRYSQEISIQGGRRRGGLVIKTYVEQGLVIKCVRLRRVRNTCRASVEAQREEGVVHEVESGRGMLMQCEGCVRVCRCPCKVSSKARLPYGGQKPKDTCLFARPSSIFAGCPLICLTM